MQPLNLDDKPLRNEQCHMEELDDEILLYHPGNNKTLYINKSASIIWQLCNGEHTVEEIIQLIAEAYPAAIDGLEKDVLDTLARLSENQAISIS
jgi:hypothetical protein